MESQSARARGFGVRGVVAAISLALIALSASPPVASAALPTLQPVPPQIVNGGYATTADLPPNTTHFDVEWTDVDAGQTHDVEVTWGDGVVDVYSSVESPHTVEHEYAAPGDYAVRVRVIDSSGSAASLFTTVVVADMSSGADTKLYGSHLQNSDRFGQAVDLDGGIGVVGEPNIFSSRGRVHLYYSEDGGDRWQLEQTMAATPQADGAGFGVAVDLDGSLLAVGARGAYRPDGIRTGAVYLFTRAVDGTWGQVQVLYPSAGNDFGDFGLALALDEGRLAVGAPGRDLVGDRRGSVHLFEQDLSGAWVEVGELISPTPANLDFFGSAVALAGSTLVVGAPGWSSSVTNPNGTVFVYDWPTGGAPSTPLSHAGSPVSGVNGQAFGASVALSGSGLLAVGAPSGTPGVSGAVHVLSIDSAALTPIATLPATTESRLGESVDIDGDLIAAHSIGGSARLITLFRLGDTGWSRDRTLSPDPGSNLALNNSGSRRVALDGGILLSGQDSDSDLTTRPTGAALVWNLTDSPPDIAPIADVEVDEHVAVGILPNVTDPDGDPFSLTWSGVPAGATATDALSWTPDEAQGAGTYEITVTATQDGAPTLFDSETFTITVLEVNEPPLLDPIGPQSGVEGVPVEFQATATDPDIPVEVLLFSMTPLAGDLSGASIDADTGEFACACATGQHLVRISVTDGSLADFEDVEISVEAATAQTDLRVSLAPSAPGQYLVGDSVPYTVLVHNAGPDAVTADLTVEPEHHDQATWEVVPPEAAINGIFFLTIGEIAPGATVPVEFEIVYGAFGLHDLTATVFGSHEELMPNDNVAVFEQQVDLSLDMPGVEAGGLAIDGANTTDGQPLAAVGLRVPAALVAGSAGDLFVPAELSRSAGMASGSFFASESAWVPGNLFLREPGQVVAGTLVLPESTAWPAAGLLVTDTQAYGDVLIPALGGPGNVPAGRLLFSDGQGTNALVSARADTSLRIERAWPAKVTPGGLAVTQADGGVLEGSVALCDGAFPARLGSGNGAGFECGSLTTTVLSGQVSIELGDTLLTAPAGSVVHVVEADDGGWDVTVNEGGPITLTGEDGTAELGAGESTHVAAAGTPTADPGGPYLGAVNTPIALDGSASSDPDDEPLTYAWSADGGTITDSTSDTPSFTASEAGIFALTLEVCDTSANCDTAITSVVVYDPSAGFVTGGGWIDSQPGSCGSAAPEGACVGDPTGRATFGFVSRYKKGADLPDGQTEFVFQAGGLRFHSDSYEWLVVAGKDRAQFKGSGSVNGIDGYRFILTAYDSGGTDPDGFRIKIWNEIGVGYDNRSGADDSLTVANTQAIGGGSIVIHRK